MWGGGGVPDRGLLGRDFYVCARALVAAAWRRQAAAFCSPPLAGRARASQPSGRPAACPPSHGGGGSRRRCRGWHPMGPRLRHARGAACTRAGAWGAGSAPERPSVRSAPQHRSAPERRWPRPPRIDPMSAQTSPESTRQAVGTPPLMQPQCRRNRPEFNEMLQPVGESSLRCLRIRRRFWRSQANVQRQRPKFVRNPP